MFNIVTDHPKTINIKKVAADSQMRNIFQEMSNNCLASRRKRIFLWFPGQEPKAHIFVGLRDPAHRVVPEHRGEQSRKQVQPRAKALRGHKAPLLSFWRLWEVVPPSLLPLTSSTSPQYFWFPELPKASYFTVAQEPLQSKPKECSTGESQWGRSGPRHWGWAQPKTGAQHKWLIQQYGHALKRAKAVKVILKEELKWLF